jgi:hypothetical protein
MGGAGITLGWPLALWALALCPLMLLAVFRSRAVMSRRMLALVTALRVLVVALVVLAIADARAVWPTDELAVATIVDGSASLSMAERDALTKRARWLEGNHPEVAWLDLADDPNAPDRSATDVGVRISTALALLPRDKVRRIVVATDGREDAAGLLPALRRAADDGVEVSVVPAGDRPAIDQVAVSGVEVPRLIRAGETASVEVRLHCLEAQEVSLRLSLDGVTVGDAWTVSAPAGASAHVRQVPFADEGVRALAVEATAARDTLPANDRWSALVHVASPPRVLLVRPSGQGATASPPLAKVLQDARLRVDVVDASNVQAQRAEDLNRYQLVVLDEASPDLIQEPQLRAIREWVEASGGGLISITGVNAVRSQPAVFREIDPLIPPRAIPETPPLELILVIDRSGSMSGNRIDMARQAAIAAVQALRPDSRVGLVAFSGSPDTVIPPVDMSQANWIMNIISGLSSGGGTDIASAMNAAGSVMSSDPGFLHHIVLLSDGVSDEGAAIAAAQALAWRGITISTISLGNRNTLMSGVATIGQGRYYAVDDPSQLPQLFVREAQYRQAPPHRVVDFRPEVVETMPFLEGVDFAADQPIGGYVLAEARPEAQTVLRSPDGDPILAHWAVGAGRVASFATTSAGAWSDRWRTGQSFARLWSQMAWDMLRERVEGELEMRVDAHPSDRSLEVVTVAANDLSTETVPFVVLARGPSGPAGGPAPLVKPLDLIQRGPGLWQAEVDRVDGFIATGHLREGDEPVAAVAVDNPYPRELAAFGPDRPALELIAETGNGRVLDGLEQILTLTGDEVPTSQKLRVPMLLAALLIYLASVLLLRLPRNARGAAARLAKREEKKAANEPEAKVAKKAA